MHTPPAPQPVLGQQVHPAGHCPEFEHVGRPAQETFWPEKHDASVVTKQKQHAPSAGFGRPPVAQPPAGTHERDGFAFADAVAAEIREPAPSTAAPTPARLSSFCLETRSSVTAIQ